MDKLEIHINAVLEQLKRPLADATWESRRQYFGQMLRVAKSLGITEPCQELYDAYIADDKGSKERRSLHIRCVKLIDAAAGTGAKDNNGKLYNGQEMPAEGEVIEYYEGSGIHSSKYASIDCVIVKSEIEMRYLKHSVSTMGQYRHSWMEIRQYFMDNETVDYDEALLQKYIHENDARRNEGSTREWKWKINRKSAYVLMEVAKTGGFKWGLIERSNSFGRNPALESIRSQYQNDLRQKNLSESTVYMHDYVFRRGMEFVGVDNPEALMGLSAAQVQRIVSGFAGVCNARSMATILPTLRSMLHAFHGSGWIDKDLSGAVMSGFLQKGSVAAYLSGSDETKLVAQLEFESKRNKTIILLALRLGLRDCDIRNLTFDQIDWNGDKLRLTQTKTGNPLVLPLLPEVGNALMEYITKERPRRRDSYPYVFLRSQAPHDKLSSAYQLCSELFAKLKIKPVNGEKSGMHIFRYTVAHKLLAAKVPHQVITDVLGHSSKESDKPYISMDDAMLKKCSLDLADTGGISWGVARNG
jgi:site-specific recombinase XerD